MALVFNLNQPAPFDLPVPDRLLDTVVVIVTPPRPAAPRLASRALQPAEHFPGLDPAEWEAVTWHDAEWQ